MSYSLVDPNKRQSQCLESKVKVYDFAQLSGILQILPHSFIVTQKIIDRLGLNKKQFERLIKSSSISITQKNGSTWSSFIKQFTDCAAAVLML